MDKEKIYEEIAQYLKNEGAEKVAIFGSYVHDEEEPDSDLDVLVKFSKTKSLLELVRIERELSEQIGIEIDLLTEESLSPYIKDKLCKKELTPEFEEKIKEGLEDIEEDNINSHQGVKEKFVESPK